MIPIQVTLKPEQFTQLLQSLDRLVLAQEHTALAIEKLSATDQAEIDELVRLQSGTKAKLQALLDAVSVQQ